MFAIRNLAAVLAATLLSTATWAQDCASTGLVEVTAGSWGEEISWSLMDEAGVTVAEGSDYASFSNSAVDICLGSGCHTLLLLDSFGDGWNGASWTLTDASGQIFGPYTLPTGSSAAIDVPIEGTCGTAAEGCTDPDAVNFNPDATEDNGSCLYEADCLECNPDEWDPVCALDPTTGQIYTYPSPCIAACSGAELLIEWDCEGITAGCTDPTAVNYDPYASVDDGSCIAACEDGGTPATFYLCTFANGNEVALDIVHESGDTLYSQSGFGNVAIVYEDFCLEGGCYTATLSNNEGNTGWYNGYFTLNGSNISLYNITLSDDATSATFAFSTDGSCASVPGCTNAEAPNYDLEATFDDGSCLPVCACDDEPYEPVCVWDWTNGEYITVDNLCEAECLGWSIVWVGDCSEQPVYGCTDASALNYNPEATMDQGCLFAPECETGQIEVSIEMYADATLPYWQAFFSVSNALEPGIANIVTYSTDSATYGVGCLDPGCYNFWAYESMGSDLVTIEATAGDETMAFTLEPGAYSNTWGWAVGIDEPCTVQYGGCTDPEAENYNPSATFDNGSCTYPLECDEGIVATLYLCTFSNGEAVGLNISASDGTVIYDQQGYSDMEIMYTEICIDPTECYTVTLSNLWNDYGWYGGYYWIDAEGIQIGGGELSDWETTATDTFGWFGACDAEATWGCTDPTASNYDETATVDDGSCIYPSPCPLGQEVTFNLIALTDAELELTSAAGEILASEWVQGDWAATVCLEDGCYNFRLESADGNSLQGSFAMMMLEDGTVATMVAGNAPLMDEDFGIGMECGNGTNGFTPGGSPWDFDETIAFAPYPNPTETVVNVNGGGWDEQFPIDVTVRDVAGKVVHRMRVPAGGTPRIEVHAWPAGMYVMDIRQGGRVGHAPFMKVR